jgi:predicted  nucleic acid-binding Zn-ribbon protein
MIGVQQLHELLAIDSNIQHSKSAVVGIDEVLNDGIYISGVRQLALQAKKAFGEEDTMRKSMEMAAETVREKASAVEARLYSGSVRNPKELEDIQAELVYLRQSQSDQEEELLSIMELSEESKMKMLRLEGQLHEAEIERQEKHRRLIEEKASLQSSLEVLDKQRDELASKIKLEYLGVYDRLRAKGQSHPVVKIERGLCLGCRVALPTQVINMARKSESLIQCPSCSRILYAT